MDTMAQHLTNALVEYRIINPSKYSYYEYAIIIVAERTIAMVSMLLISLIVGKVIQGVLLMTFFSLLRRFTGGYHAKTFGLCYLESILSFVIVLFLGDYLALYPIFQMGMLFFSFLLIMKIGTINHPNMKYSGSELRESKKAARYVLVIETFIIISLEYLGALGQYVCFMSLGIVMCAIGVVLAKLTKQEVEV